MEAAHGNTSQLRADVRTTISSVCRGREFQALIVGAQGAGKTSLVNFISAVDVVADDRVADNEIIELRSASLLRSCAGPTRPYEVSIEGHAMRLWECPCVREEVGAVTLLDDIIRAQSTVEAMRQAGYLHCVLLIVDATREDSLPTLKGTFQTLSLVLSPELLDRVILVISHTGSVQDYSLIAASCREVTGRNLQYVQIENPLGRLSSLSEDELRELLEQNGAWGMCADDEDSEASEIRREIKQGVRSVLSLLSLTSRFSPIQTNAISAKRALVGEDVQLFSYANVVASYANLVKQILSSIPSRGTRVVRNSKVQALLANGEDPEALSVLLVATGTWLCLASTGALVGATTGGVFGTACGAVPAVFTFGLSLPVGAAVGSASGLAVGVVTGASTGLLCGAATGFGLALYRLEIWNGAVCGATMLSDGYDLLVLQPVLRVQGRARRTRDGVHSLGHRAKGLISNRSFQITAAGAAGGALTFGAAGAVGGTLAGSATGAAFGVPFALFTFGLSIPVCAVVGGGAGLCVGATAGSSGGAAIGGAAGFVGYKCRGVPRKTADPVRLRSPILKAPECTGSTAEVCEPYLETAAQPEEELPPGMESAESLSASVELFEDAADFMQDTEESADAKEPAMTAAVKPQSVQELADAILSNDDQPDAFESFESISGSSRDETETIRPLCRGRGHVRCSHCYCSDRFGRHELCQRQCAMIGGSWGPSLCATGCMPVARGSLSGRPL